MTTRPRLIVKTRAGRGMPMADGFRFEKTRFRVEPLFQEPPEQGGFSLAGGDRWFLVEPEEEIGGEENPWDVAHRAVRKNLGFAAADAPELVEPDLEQEWVYENPSPLVDPDADPGIEGDRPFHARESAEGPELCRFDPQKPRNGRTPVGPSAADPQFGWFLRDDFSQLDKARTKVGSGGGGKRVRIAHIDTGYDPDHVTLPQHLNRDLQRNFVDGEDPRNAADPARRGLLRNPGHGTGTLGILAGNKLAGVPEAGPFAGKFLGGAPHAEVVPLRVANSVVHFFTSAVARAFEYLTVNGADVVSMSMGGVASAAWTAAVNRAYEAGVVIVCAAGNNFGRLPTRFIVYPARYKRAIAALGAMADHSSYTGLPIKIMQGNWGPRRKMKTALAAYTPNMPWSELGCDKIVDMDGQGTSSATPQVAAAAALWLAKHRPQYSQGWMKVEAVRKALFDSARDPGGRRLGRGIVQAHEALAITPAAEQALTKTKRDRATFSVLRVLTGLGVARTERATMLELEASQLLQRSRNLEEIFERHDIDPDAPPRQLQPKVQQELMEALAAEPRASDALRAFVEHSFLRGPRRRVPVERDLEEKPVEPPKVPAPSVRTLRAFAFDPSLGFELETAILNETTIKVPWEELEPGPVGAYLEVVDIDPASGSAYAPVDLDDPHLVARQGLDPSEGSPQFHQQMVYAVAMRTIRNFERALGRSALWSVRRTRRKTAEGKTRYRKSFVPRLRIYPHALREANAYYSPERKALLFGYFPASRADAGRNLPGGMVFSCLSHDIVAHETTHALLDGLHRRFAEPTNPDVLAFHEAFADIVALFQHFSFPEALRHQIAKTRGDLGQQNLLGQLAQQFGEAIGHYGALRDALGEIDPETRTWKPLEPDPDGYLTVMEPHARGAILVAAVFDAFRAIYQHRSRDLMRLASGGSGVLPQGEIHPDLVERLAEEAAKTAQHVLTICIRALDYCPPVDVTFGEYLRALITADYDLVPNDPRHYRVAFIEAFRRHGIYPSGVRTLSVDSLRWREPRRLNEMLERNAEQAESARGKKRAELRKRTLEDLFEKLDLTWDLDADRREAYRQSNRNHYLFWRWMRDTLLDDETPLEELGLTWERGAPERVARNKKKEIATELHSVRPARRLAPDGSFVTELVVEITQRRVEPCVEGEPELGEMQYRGGCTMLIDVKNRRIRYCVKKDICDDDRLRRQRRFEVAPSEASLRASYFADRNQDRREPFALLHRG